MEDFKKTYDEFMELKRLSFYYGNEYTLKIMFNKLLQAAEEGIIEACLEVAEGYNKGIKPFNGGIVVEPNEELAIKWYERAYEYGSAKAALTLAKEYYNKFRGLDEYAIKSDVKLAIKWYERAGELGSLEGYRMVSGIYFRENNSVFHENNNKKGEEILRKCVSMGDIDSLVILAERLKEGNGVTKDLKEAFELFSKAKDQGIGYAIYQLGLFYKDGLYIDKNIKKALALFEECGLGDGTYQIGYCYETGNGVEKNYEKAMEYYFKADREYSSLAGERKWQIEFSKDIDPKLREVYYKFRDGKY